MSNYTNTGLANQTVRDYAKKHGVPMWLLASELQISECTIGRRLRTELPQAEQKRWIEAIDVLAERAGVTEG